MKKADIEVGKAYRTQNGWPLYGAKVRVLEKDVPHRYLKQKGTRVVVEQDLRPYFQVEGGRELVVASRTLLAPWTEADDAGRVEYEALMAQRDALRARIADIEGIKQLGNGIHIDLEHASEFLDRAGVPR